MKINDQKEMKLYITDKDVANEDEGDAVMEKMSGKVQEVETNETKSARECGERVAEDMMRYISESLEDCDKLVPLMYHFIKAILKK